MRSGLFHALAGSALCAACGGRGVVESAPSTVDIPAGWSQPSEGSELPVGDYWTRFGDPLLTDFVEQAIVRNRDLAVAASRVAQARAGVRQARAGYLPSVFGNAGVRRDVGDFADDDFAFSLGADVQWQIDLFGRIRYDVAASRANLLAAGYGLGDVQRLIVGQVAQTTVSARALAVQLAIARQTLSVQDDNFQIAEWRNEAGLVSSLDVEQARAQRAQTAATIPALERDLAASANTISTLIGEPPGRVLSLLTENAADIPAPPEEVGYDVPIAVIRRRPDVQQAEAFLAADTAQIGLARAQLLPLLQVTGNINTASLGLGGLFDTITGNLFAGLSQLIFDGGRLAAQVDVAEAIAAGSFATYERTILQSLEDVESAAAALRGARERVVLFAEARDAADVAAILARSQYQAGLVDFQALLTAENQLLNSRNAYAASEAERANAFVRLTQALGGGWDPETVEFAIDPPEIILTGSERTAQ
ncbi:efflux transporter outer membrane subunit [Erythrobacter litoralis]|uniref:efflux transporter outer membrane subunit n=1 Tax=Erythrobacter litoralis TaxID=39960 RepID=UPI002435EC08|nr:efflux transporter outer membrane subunit [Erythrobacter litoralis]MDG6077919.1 efflux transporter outer membrane subunit [Erythrobacter litoralis]